MKRITIKQYLLACFVLPMILAGCNDADYQVIDNAIYLNEASENGSAKVTVDPENVTTTTLTVCGTACNRKCDCCPDGRSFYS